jgi:hypothetical protein
VKLPIGLALVALSFSASGCKKPAEGPSSLETVSVIAPDSAPGLNEPEDDEGASVILHHGDVVIARQPMPRLKWAGVLEGAHIRRDSPVVGVELRPWSGNTYVFSEDLGPPVEVETTHAICATAPGATPSGVATCERALRRILLDDGAVIGYTQCAAPGCAVVWKKGERASWGTLDGLSFLHSRKIAGRNVLIAVTRFVDGRDHTGGKLLVLSAAPGFARLGELALEEIDARDMARVRSRTGKLITEPGRYVFEGTRFDADARTGKRSGESSFKDELSLDALPADPR